jgi:hypothetical protein
MSTKATLWNGCSLDARARQTQQQRPIRGWILDSHQENSSSPLTSSRDDIPADETVRLDDRRAGLYRYLCGVCAFTCLGVGERRGVSRGIWIHRGFFRLLDP